jgi:D-alanyl-D-alanine carboxypeptidase (penicillin-binding protein 5/6)
MKKLTAALCAVLLVLCVCLPGASAAGPALSATRAYCIVDADTGLVLAQQNMNEELHPASITKVMTLGLACEKAQGNWDGVKLTVTHEDVYSLAGTDSSHIALREGEEVPLVDALYATQMASANDGANLLAEYFGGGTIEGGVAKMNEQVEELGLAHTHFANPHGISDEDHYTSCYDMAQILRWALEQPGFEDVFTRSEMYTMQPTNVQPVTRYFSQQDKMRIGSSRYHVSSILGSKIGYTNTARYSYACLAEQNGVRLICVTMQSELSTDKYNDVRTLLDYAFSTFTGYTDLPAQGVTAQLPVTGGGESLGTVTVSDPGVRLLLADGLSAKDVTVSLELPETYVLGTEPEVYAVYTIRGGTKQESTSVRVKAEISGLTELLENSTGTELEAAKAVQPKGRALWLLGISLGSTVAAAAVTFFIVRLLAKRKKRRARSASRHGK